MRLGETDGFEARIVPCRTCGCDVEISGFAVMIAVQASNFCRLKGWAPLRPNEITFCPPCGADHRLAAEQRSEAAFSLLRKLRHAVNMGSSPGMVFAGAPSWFAVDYEKEIAAILSSAGKLSTRKPTREI